MELLRLRRLVLVWLLGWLRDALRLPMHWLPDSSRLVGLLVVLLLVRRCVLLAVVRRIAISCLIRVASVVVLVPAATLVTC